MQMNIILSESTYKQLENKLFERKQDYDAYLISKEIFQSAYNKLKKLTDNGTLSSEEVLNKVNSVRGVYDITNGIVLMYGKGSINYPNNLKITIVQEGHTSSRGMAGRKGNTDNIYLYVKNDNNFYPNVAQIFYRNRQLFVHELKHLMDLNKEHKIWKNYILPPDDGNDMGMRRYALQNAEVSAVFHDIMYKMIESAVDRFNIIKEEWNDETIRQSNIEWYEENLGRKLSEEEAYEIHLTESGICHMDTLVSHFYAEFKKKVGGFVPKKLEKKIKGRAYTVFELLINRLGVDCSKKLKY